MASRSIILLFILIFISDAAFGASDKIIRAEGTNNLILQTGGKNNRLTIDSTGIIGFPGLTINRVPFIDASNNLVTDPGLLFDGTTFTFPITDGTFLTGDGSNVKSEVTISGDLTISNTGVAAIGSGVIVDADVNASANINASKLGTGVLTNTEFNLLDGITGTLATLAGTEVFTNKDIDGGIASNSLRFTLPKNTTANLAGLTRKEATIFFDSTLKQFFGDDGTAVIPLGGGGAEGGGQFRNFFSEDNPENLDAWTCGNNVVFDGGGTENGTQARITSALIDTTDTANVQFTQAASSLNDYCRVSFAVDEDQFLTWKIFFTYDGAANDMQLEFLCLTTGTIIKQVDIPAAGESTELTGTLFIPSGCGNLITGYSVSVENIGAILKTNQYIISSNLTIDGEITTTEHAHFFRSTALGSTNTFVPQFTTEGYNTVVQAGTVDNTDGWSFTASQEVDVVATYCGSRSGASQRLGWIVNGSGSTAITSQTAGTVVATTFSTGDQLDDCAVFSGILQKDDVLQPNLNVAAAGAAFDFENILNFKVKFENQTKVFSGVSAENKFTAIIDTGPDTVLDENVSGWVSSVTNVATGEVKITHAFGNTNLMACGCTISKVGAVATDGTCNVHTRNTNDFTLKVISVASAVFDTQVKITCDKHGVDYIDPIRSVIVPETLTAMVYEELSSGTDAGTFTSGSFVTRALNTTSGDSFLTLSSNRFKLPKGIYIVWASAPAFAVDANQIKLRNITDSIDLKFGASVTSGATNFVTSTSILNHSFSISSPTEFEIQHRATTTKATNGLGRANAFGNVQIYTQIRITKVK